MRKKTPPKRIVSNRKLGIVEHLHHYSVSTIEQIKREFFKNRHLSSTYKEMRKLIKQGLVEKIYIDNNKTPKGVYTLSIKGAAAISSEAKEIFANKKFRPQSVLHDLDLVDVAFAFKAFAVVKNYYTENQLLENPAELYAKNLERVGELRPDALVELTNLEQSYFFTVEYEAHVKSLDRIRTKINHYYDTNNLHGCLFIGSKRQIIESVRSVEEKDNSQFKPKVFYTLFENIKKHKGKLLFYGRNNEELSIK